MDGEIVLLDCVDDADLFSAFRKDVSCVTYLASHLGIERSALEHELVHGLVLGLYGAVAGQLHVLKLRVVISEELDVVAVGEFNPVSGFNRSSIARSVLLLLELDLEALEIDLVSLLGCDEL